MLLWAVWCVFRMYLCEFNPVNSAMKLFFFFNISHELRLISLPSNTTIYPCGVGQKDSYIWIIFFAFGFDMTTPNSLNKQMMSSWSITPDQRRNAQDYKTDTGTSHTCIPPGFKLMPMLRYVVVILNTLWVQGSPPAALCGASCLP